MHKAPQHSRIEWTGVTWNPVTGCTKVSAGCAHCYAERMARRLQAMGHPRYRRGFDLALHPQVLDAPLHWKHPRTIFVNSMSDLFHEDIPADFVREAFDVMNKASWHTFQILTKRSERLGQLAPLLTWSDNIWVGVTVEDNEYTCRIDGLRDVPATVRFLSLEPLLGRIVKLPLAGIDWIIVGGESGPYARPMHADWARSIRDRCQRRGVPFFFKQWGGKNKKKAGRQLDGRTWNEMPTSRRRQHRKPSPVPLIHTS